MTCYTSTNIRRIKSRKCVQYWGTPRSHEEKSVGPLTSPSSTFTFPFTSFKIVSAHLMTIQILRLLFLNPHHLAPHQRQPRITWDVQSPAVMGTEVIASDGDVILVVGGTHKLLVSSSQMRRGSPVFDAMFSGNFAEGTLLTRSTVNNFHFYMTK